MEPFAGANEEEDPELFSPARTMISVGASACNKPSLEETKEVRRKQDTHADLPERRGEYRTGVRRRKSEQEGGRDAIERAGLDEDPEDGETRRPDALGVPLDGLPEPVADQQRRPELRRYREGPRRDQPVVHAREEDGVRWGEARKVGEGGIARDWKAPIRS